MEHFGAEYDLSFEDYLSPFAPPTSRDTGPIPALSWEDDPFVSAEVTGLSPATEVGEVASGRDPDAADSDHIPTASSADAGAAAEQDELASEGSGVKVVNQLKQLAEEGPALLTAGLMESERWSDAAEQVAFREAVLAAHIARTKQRKGPAHPDLQPSDLAVVPGTKVKMATAAAARAGELLQAANRAITDARSASGTDIGATVKITAQSGYRGSEHQARLWRAYFTRYYNQTDRARQRLAGGPHSPAAVKYMLDVYKIPRRIAAPGYSNHQPGIAIDFRQVLKSTDRIRNSTERAAIERWRTTWFYRWLQQHAARFGFQPYTAEPWHWEYRPDGAQREQEALAFEMEEPVSERWAEEERWGPEEAEEPEFEGWAETEQWEAGQSEDPELEGWSEADRWGTERIQQPEFEPLGEKERWGAEESEEPETNGWTEAQRWDGEDLEETKAFHEAVSGDLEAAHPDLVAYVGELAPGEGAQKESDKIAATQLLFEEAEALFDRAREAYRDAIDAIKTRNRIDRGILNEKLLIMAVFNDRYPSRAGQTPSPTERDYIRNRIVRPALFSHPRPKIPAAPGSKAMVGVFGQKPEGYLFVPVADMVPGIDVAHHQGIIDWARVAAAGVRFAYMKCTEGATWQDPQFAANWARSLANGIPRGAYHLLKRPTSSTAAAQVQNFLTNVTFQAGDLPPFLDVEYRDLTGIIKDMGVVHAWRHIWDWCEGVKNATGYQPLLYISKRGIDELQGNVGSLPALELWMPHYRNVNNLPPLPEDSAGNLIFPHWSFWQHSETGNVAGISGPVDLNLFNGNARNIAEWMRNVQPHA
jgi:GH25 family lysozyme M1 (1,4-beta-N-acetylmuramidase)/LAS superfamily LD-carboxypeptidase LdcB